MRNIALLEQTMQHIKDHPEQHRQDRWSNACGTVACFAGWAGLLSGWNAVDIAMLSERMWYEGAKLLGLSDREARILFDANNTQPMLELMVKDLVNGDELMLAEQYDDETRP